MPLLAVKTCNFTDVDGTDVINKYGAPIVPGAAPYGCEVQSNGFAGINTTAEQGNIWDSGSSADVDKGTIHPKYHYSQVLTPTVGTAYSPGALTRGAIGGDDYGNSPHAHTGGLEIFEHTSSTWTQIAIGGVSIPVGGDTYRLETKVGNSHDALISGISQVSVTDSTHASGDPGIYCFSNAGAGVALGDDWEAGNLSANLDVLEFKENNWLGHRLNLRRTRVRERFNRIMAGTQ